MNLVNLIKKTSVIAIALIGFVAITANAKVYKISTLLPDGTYSVTQLKAASKAIAERTEGRVKIKIYPGGVMGDDKTVMSKIRIGQLHGFQANGGALAPFYKDAQVYNTPLAFNNFDDVDKVRKKLDANIVKGYEDNGWKTFGVIESGFAYVMSSKKILSIEDLKSSKLWLPANDPISEKISNAYGVSAIFLGIGDVLTALQTGAVDTIIAPPVAALTLQWFTKVNTVTDMPFMYTYSAIALSAKHFKKMSPADQAIVEEELGKVSTAIDGQNRKDNLSAFTALQSQGLEMLKLSVDEKASIKATSDKAINVLIKDGEFSQSAYDQFIKVLETP
ncbi:TRAP transporter substrate-binding protein DctP [Teredinibacter sp. KSP-S5-2]|uniref:TRAP transporter substrate-binding protein DctP n=1 Tax=Teredinibacter sp. KSP-S5-2 TaxID=3034506 RepID=UPI002934D01E|nr:TRAP transporter substrate-binding protein DctP [Teredinibacter sp. KSP-S5-2]WNO09649.1 TRAP transporter substrate-binding protein DctP [Teredinibacter sp. KSP-S5-2]